MNVKYLWEIQIEIQTWNQVPKIVTKAIGVNELAQEEHVNKGNRGSKIEYVEISMFKMWADEMTHKTD